MAAEGVELSWTAGTDINWLDHYQVQRDGADLGTVTAGTYFFDRSPAAAPHATYSVRSVDRNGNVSVWVNSTASGSAVTAIDDAGGAGITYSGSWVHDSTSYPQAYAAALSGSNTTGDYAQYTFTGNKVTA